jgi:serine/threonine protein kinase
MKTLVALGFDRIDTKSEYENSIVPVFSREWDVLLRVVHPFIVSGHCGFQSQLLVTLIMDYIPDSDLYSRLTETGRLSKDEARFYAAEILLGLEHLHKAGSVHRDLKPENVLIDEDGHAKITFCIGEDGNAHGKTKNDDILWNSGISCP